IELRDLAEDSDKYDDGPGLCDQQQRLPTRVGNVLQAPGHAYQSQRVERRKRHPEADEPAPEAGLAPTFVEGEAERLREPVGDTRQRAEYNAANNDIMEMGDLECAVVKH